MARGPPAVANPVPSVFLEPLSSIMNAELYPTLKSPGNTKPYQSSGASGMFHITHFYRFPYSVRSKYGLMK
ncbi:hypothetical protein BDV24DRAFT_121249 [Aspergillus arachidicola]|uniref:Uncharacterized protein n=1 Tax=Aspergillus arachidicola TaxID=656916 RepID=A0A5N6YSV3_9EURO|nr:hypothetical protein BDV24DRAFT_121249 [Aspergillus arachidicola]